MKIEIILLGVIGLVFLVDFIMNSRKKPSIDNVVDQNEGVEAVNKKRGNRKFILILTVLINVLITLWIIFFEDADFLRPINGFDGELIVINYLIVTYSFLYIINLFLFPLFLYNVNFDYLLKRKKNFTIYIILIPLTKLFIHFFIYTDTNYDYLEEPSDDKDLAHHLDVIFTNEIWLFIPAFIIVSLLVWFFNDKIKAR